MKQLLPLVGSATTTDGSRSGHAYKLMKQNGQDHASFEINASTGELSLLAQPDAEVQSSYIVSVRSTDAGRNTYRNFDIQIKEDPGSLGNLGYVRYTIYGRRRRVSQCSNIFEVISWHFRTQ